MRQQSEQIKERLVSNWATVQAIAATVPPPAAMAGWLETAGAPNQPAQIHIDEEEVALALRYAMYVRDRLTILELGRMLGLVEVQ